MANKSITVEVVLKGAAEQRAAAARTAGTVGSPAWDFEQKYGRTADEAARQRWKEMNAAGMAPSSRKGLKAEMRAEIKRQLKEEKHLETRREFFSYEVSLAYRSGRRPWSRRGMFRKMLSSRLTSGLGDAGMDRIVGAAGVAGAVVTYADMARKILPFMMGALRQAAGDGLLGEQLSKMLDLIQDKADQGFNLMGAAQAGLSSGMNAASSAAIIGGGVREAGVSAAVGGAQVAFHRANVGSQFNRYALGRYGAESVKILGEMAAKAQAAATGASGDEQARIRKLERERLLRTHEMGAEKGQVVRQVLRGEK